MLKKAPSFVLASHKASMHLKGYASAFRSLPPRWKAFLNILLGRRFPVDFKTQWSLSLFVLAAVLLIFVEGCGVPLEEQKAHIRKNSLPFQVLTIQAFLETWGKPTYVHQENTQFYPVKTGNYVPRFRAPLGEVPAGWDASVVSEPAVFLGYVDRGQLLGFINDHLVYREQLSAAQIHEIGKNWQHEAIFKTRLETDLSAPPKP
jgi:hypothetical protein